MMASIEGFDGMKKKLQIEKSKISLIVYRMKRQQKPEDSTMRDLQRLLWLVDGVAINEFSPKLLMLLMRGFEKADVVPSHYNQPELYQEQDELNTVDCETCLQEIRTYITSHLGKIKAK